MYLLNLQGIYIFLEKERERERERERKKRVEKGRRCIDRH
jgi:hypothetical protein